MPHKKKRLALLRSRLQNKLKAQAFFEERMKPCTELFAYLQQFNIDFDILDLVGVDEEYLPNLTEAFQKLPYNVLSKTIGKSTVAEQLDQLFIAYPSINALRYVPPINIIDISQGSKTGLKKAIDSLGLKNQPVYMYYLRYAPLMKLQLYDLTTLDNENLFNFCHGDVVIFPKDLSWLIAHTLEEEWYAGRLSKVIK